MLSAQVRTAGVFGSLFMSSLLMRENVLALIMAQVRHGCAPKYGCSCQRRRAAR